MQNFLVHKIPLMLFNFQGGRGERKGKLVLGEGTGP